MKRIGLLLAMPLAAAGLFFGGCREAKKKNCRELFYRHYEAQVKGFMRATPDANPLLSRKVAEYMRNRMFELDTAFVCLEGEALEAFQRKYGRLLQREYDSVVAVYGDCRGRFEKCYDENIKGFMRTMLDTDTVLARKRAAFALKRAYEIDSAFVWMEGAQLTEFLDSIRLVIREEIARIR